MKKHKAPATVTDQEIADERLRPIRIWAHANHGAVKRLSEKLTEITGQPIQRQTVGRWIHKDPEKRQQPNYGFGLLLERAVQEVQQTMAGERDAEWQEPSPPPKKPAKKVAKQAKS